MKVFIKIIILLSCVIPCFIFVGKSYEPKNIKYKEYLMNFEACLTTQKALNSALDKFGRDKSIFKDVRSDLDFSNVEKELINSDCLDKNYNKATPDCLYVINEGELYCACHSNIKQISDNINSVNRLADRNRLEKFGDYLTILMCSLLIILVLFK